MSKGDFIIGLMENNFKEILPNGLESYDGLEDQMDEDGDFQLKVN